MCVVQRHFWNSSKHVFAENWNLIHRIRSDLICFWSSGLHSATPAPLYQRQFSVLLIFDEKVPNLFSHLERLKSNSTLSWSLNLTATETGCSKQPTNHGHSFVGLCVDESFCASLTMAGRLYAGENPLQSFALWGLKTPFRAQNSKLPAYWSGTD